MEGCCHDFSLPHGNRILALRSEYFYLGPHAFDLGSADKDHFHGRTVELSFPDGAFELAAVGIAADANVEHPQAVLLRVLDLVGQQNGSGTGAEGGFYADELFELLESIGA